jgi:hypothetical protein
MNERLKKRSYAEFLEDKADKGEFMTSKSSKRVKFNDAEEDEEEMREMQAIRDSLNEVKAPFVAINTPWPKNRYREEDDSNCNSMLKKPWMTMDKASNRLSFNEIGMPVASQNDL